MPAFLPSEWRNGKKALPARVWMGEEKAPMQTLKPDVRTYGCGAQTYTASVELKVWGPEVTAKTCPGPRTGTVSGGSNCHAPRPEDAENERMDKTEQSEG